MCGSARERASTQGNKRAGARKSASEREQARSADAKRETLHVAAEGSPDGVDVLLNLHLAAERTEPARPLPAQPQAGCHARRRAEKRRGACRGKV